MLRTFVLLVAGLFSVAAYADPVTSPDASPGPFQLSPAQMDTVTAGVSLLLPAVQKVQQCPICARASFVKELPLLLPDARLSVAVQNAQPMELSSGTPSTLP